MAISHDRRVKKVITLDGNWNGDKGQFRTIEETGEVMALQYHECMAPGDQHFVDVHYKSGHSARIFNIKEVLFHPSAESF